MANSTTIITDLGTVVTNGPSSVTAANANAAAGPIMDYLGNVKLLQLKAQEMAVLIVSVLAVTDAGTDSTNRNLLLAIQSDMT